MNRDPWRADKIIIVISEIGKWNIDFFKSILKGYSFYVDLPAHGNYGGVGIFVKSFITCTFLPDLKLIMPNPPAHKNILEDVWLEVIKNDEKYIIGGIYRHPNTDVKLFTEIMENRLDTLHKTKKQLQSLITFIGIIIDIAATHLL